MSQLTYLTDMPTAIAGLTSDVGEVQSSTRLVPSAKEVEAGLAVVWAGGASDNEAQVISSSAKPFGIAMRDTVDPDDTLTYQAGDEFPVLHKGKIWVKLDGDVAEDDSVFVRYRIFTQIVSIVFDADFVTSNTINGTFGGAAITAVPFNTTHAQTIEDLADQIALSEFVSSVSFDAVTRTILATIDPAIEGNVDDYTTSTGFTVTGGASQAVDTVTEDQAPSSNNVIGGFRADTDDTGAGVTAVAVTQARFLTSGSANGLALLQINLP